MLVCDLGQNPSEEKNRIRSGQKWIANSMLEDVVLDQFFPLFQVMNFQQNLFWIDKKITCKQSTDLSNGAYKLNQFKTRSAHIWGCVKKSNGVTNISCVSFRNPISFGPNEALTFKQRCRCFTIHITFDTFEDVLSDRFLKHFKTSSRLQMGWWCESYI